MVATAVPVYPVSQDADTLKVADRRLFSLLMLYPVVLAGREHRGETVGRTGLTVMIVSGGLRL